jgi:protein-S-isoprenylcysteine O-methyltransferase Ste14
MQGTGMINSQAFVAPSKMLKWARSNTADLAERALLAAAFVWFLIHLMPAVEANYINLVVVVSESLVVLMALVRRTGSMSQAPVAWIAAFVGTFPPLFVVVQGQPLIPGSIAGMLMLAGLLVSIAAKFHLNLSFGIVAANRGVKRSGPYRLVRHPMYLGYALTHVGFVLFHPAMLNIAIYVATWAAMAVRIQCEEQILKQDAVYRDYAGHVHYRLLPGVY